MPVSDKPRRKYSQDRHVASRNAGYKLIMWLLEGRIRKPGWNKPSKLAMGIKKAIFEGGRKKK